MRLVPGLSALIVYCSLIAAPIFAQSEPAPRYIGAGITAGLNFHSLNEPVFIGSTLCGIFTSGVGIRPNGFVAFEMPLESRADYNGWWIFPRLHLNSLGATITTPATDNGNVRSTVDSSLIPATREHRLASSIVELGADLFASYQFAPYFKIFGGPTIGAMLSANETQTEVITAPANAYFDSTFSNTRTLANGKIPNASSIFASLTLGVGSNIPISKTARLTPELTFSYPLTEIRSDVSWRVIALRLGTGLEFNIASKPAPPVVVEAPPKKHSLSATVKLLGVIEPTHPGEGGSEVSVPSIRVEEFVRREAYPLLNFIFFDEGSAEIPSRYYSFADNPGAQSFQLNSLVDQPVLNVYYHTLNIVGRRMLDHPGATLQLIGSNENTGGELNAIRLSQSRAEAVKKYLVDIWGIPSSRITTEATNLPRTPSPLDTKEGREENRRVEILSNEPAILDPIATEAIDRTMNPPVLRVRTSITSTSPETTSLTLQQGGKVLQDFGEARTMQDWKPLQREIPSAEQPIVAVLEATNKDGDAVTVRDSGIVKQITIQKKRQERSKDKIIERYSLITFDFDRSELDQRSKRVIADIAQHVTAQDTIKVEGYTDLTGEANHNKQLSGERAKQVQEALHSATLSRASTASIVAAGEGEKNLVDNALPEGRFLSRTVNIRIERPFGSE